ncbi:MAG: glycine--tRNA ligase [Candidatus Poseidoniia archaeon]|jgi:glycyl-tRNA synthetase|nr:glycine--tRNA ligase [Candidatus Poseidoniia archaeon]
MNFREVMALAKRRGILQPAYEPYGGVAGFFDYGPVGVRLRRKIIELWRQHFVLGFGALEIDSALIGPESLFKASGHLSEFDDLLVECLECNKLHRADLLVEGGDVLDRDGVATALAGKKCESCGGNFDVPRPFNLMFSTSVGAGRGTPSYLRPETAQGIFQAFPWLLRQNRGKLPLAAAQVGRAFRNEIAPRQGPLRLREFTQLELEHFFLPGVEPGIPERLAKVEVQLVPANGNASTETISELVKEKVIGSPLVASHIACAWKFITACGVPVSKLRFRQHGKHEMAHYSNECWDGEVETSTGWVEVVGVAHRSDYDLKAHGEASGREFRAPVSGTRKKIEAWLPDKGAIGRKFKSEAANVLEQLVDDVTPGIEVVIGGVVHKLGKEYFRRVSTTEPEMIYPHVVEPSFGLDRLLYCILETTWRSEGDRSWLALPEVVSPYDMLIAPLMARDGLDKKAREIHTTAVSGGIDVFYDENGSIGRRYARADEIGISRACTIDYQTLEDGTVTIRDRDSTEQLRTEADSIF